jgi:hypothetical protein
MQCIHDLADAIGEVEPLTVFLGAGASLSSGAPPTHEVDGLLTQMFSRFRAPDLLAQMHRISGHDTAQALKTRFDGLIPYVGYRCLASLARHRRILVINMNWDPLLLAACERVGVPCLSFDLRDHNMWPPPNVLSDFVGVIDVHLHGTLSGPRHGSSAQQLPTEEEIAFLVGLHYDARRLYLGLSLEVDHDVVELGGQLDTGKSQWVYGLFRGETDAHPNLIASMATNLRARDPVFSHDPSVDFDRAMLLLADARQAPESKWGARDPHLGLPSLQVLVIPSAEVLGLALDAKASVLLGEAQIGKTTAVQLIGYLHELCSEVACSVRYVDDAATAPAAIGAPEHESPHDMLVLENPCGNGDELTVGSAVIEQILTWRESINTPRLLITSRVGDWEASGGAEQLDLPTSRPTPIDWYDRSELSQFARYCECDEHTLDMIEPGWLDTPARIREQVAGIGVSQSTDSTLRESKAITERKGLLDRSPLLARLAAVVRLQEYGGEPLPQSTVKTLLDGQYPRSAGAHLMIRSYPWEGRERLRLNHSHDRDATDSWIDENRDYLSELVAQPLCPQSLATNWEAWQLCDDARHGRWDVIADWDPKVLGDHLAAMLDVRPDANVLRLALHAEYDEWSAQDLAYSLLRAWRDLPGDERHAVLEHLMGLEDAVGTYGVLEACLYLRNAAPIEVRDAVHHQLWEFVNHGIRSWEVVLALDGFAWRVPNDAPWVHEWAEAAFEKDLSLAGVLPVLGAYHPGGVEEVGIGGRLRTVRSATLSAPAGVLATRLVRWHFVHQSRARAMLARQHWLDKGYLCRSFLPDTGTEDSTNINWLLHVLDEQGEPGWAFFAACFLMGGLEIELDQVSRQLALTMLRKANACDLGVLAAAATYDAASGPPFTHAIRDYFTQDENRDALLDTLSSGINIEGFEVKLPRFSFWSPVGKIFDWLSLRYRGIGAWQPQDLDAVVLGVRAAVARCVAEGKSSEVAGARLISLVSVGDFRDLEVAAFDGEHSDSDELVERALILLDATEPQ